VLIDIPKDVQMQAIEITHWPAPGERQPAPAADAWALSEASGMINAAKRPILYLGGGVVHAGAPGWPWNWPRRPACRP
jgi:acetolactate synthase-1/2/3 large subunit